MPYRLVTRPRVRRQIRSLSGELYQRVTRIVDSLASNPRPPGAQKLRGTDFWRIRVGDYRVLYSIDDANGVVTVVGIGHRREVYRGL